MQRANCINLVAFWIVALSQQAMKSVKHRKLCCYCPVRKKDLARLRKSTMPTYRTLLTTMTFTSTRDPLRDAEDRQSTPERNLSCLWAPVLFLSFHLRSVFTPRFTLFNFKLSFCHMAVSLLAFGLCRSNLWECCPRGLHSVISRLLAGGSLGFHIVLLLLPGSQIAGIFVICCSLLFYFAIPIPGVMEMLSSLLIRFRWLWTDQLITDRAVFGLCPVLFLVWLCGFCFAFALCFLFGLCWFLVLARWQLNGLRIDPTQFYFWCTLSILWCCHCINSRNLNMQLAFRLA